MGRPAKHFKGDGLKLKKAIEDMGMEVAEFAQAYDVKRTTLFEHLGVEKLSRAYKLLYSDLMRKPIETIWPREKPYCS